MGKRMAKFLLGLFVWLALCASSWAVTLLPNGKQQFIDGNGNPLAGGKVYFYVPSTTTPKNTWSDAAGTILNSNPVILDANGYGVIYGSGSYRQVVTTSTGTTIWDQLTADTSSISGVSWAGAGAGTANAQTITASSFTQTDGQILYYRPTVTNTGPMSLTVNGGSPIAVYIDTDTGTSASLQGGEVAASTIVGVAYSSTDGFFHLITNNFHALTTPQTIAASGTTNIGSLSSNIATITGSATITSFGSSASKSQALHLVSFSGVNTITYNATSLITPTGQNIITGAGDSALLVYLGSGNWQVYAFMPASAPGANNQTGTTYTVLSTDRDKVVTLTNALPITVTVPQATGAFASGFSTTLSNIGSTLVTVNFTTSTFSGLVSTVIPPYGSISMVSDGTNWQPKQPVKQGVLLWATTTSGTTSSFSIPVWAKHVLVSASTISSNSTGNFYVRLVTGAGTINSGYVLKYSTGSNAIVTSSSTTEVCYGDHGSAAESITGQCNIVNVGGNIWQGTGSFHSSQGPKYTFGNGAIGLAGALTGIEVSMGGDTFDAGTVSVFYE